MAISMRRVSMHPWCWWVIVRRAIVGFRQQDRALGIENRRRIAAILKTLDDGLDPDDVILESPFARLSRAEFVARSGRNREILAECDGDEDLAHAVSDRLVSGTIVRGWRPLPDPDRRLSIDFSAADLGVIENAIEALAKEDSLNHEYDQGFLAALDAIKAAETVEYKPATLEAKA